MVFIIKSNGSQRTCRIPDRAPMQASSLLEEVALALKGLTFKIEVKIVDVVQKDENPTTPTTSTPEVIRPSSSLTTTTTTQVPVNPEMATVIEQPTVPQDALAPPPPSIQPQQTIEQTPPPLKPTVVPDTTPVPKPTIAPPTLVPPQVKLTSGATKVIATGSEINEPAKVQRVYEAPLSPIRKKLGKPLEVESAPKLIKGSLKIGAIIKTCCIAVDDNARPPIAYITYDDSKLMKIVEIINEITVSIEEQPPITKINKDDIVFAKSADDNQWYRAMVEAVEDDAIDVFFFDWGLHEKLDPSRIRHMLCPDLGLSSFPACAVKLELMAASLDTINEVLKCESNFEMRVESYDDFSETYKTSILKRVET